MPLPNPKPFLIKGVVISSSYISTHMKGCEHTGEMSFNSKVFLYNLYKNNLSKHQVNYCAILSKSTPSPRGLTPIHPLGRCGYYLTYLADLSYMCWPVFFHISLQVWPRSVEGDVCWRTKYKEGFPYWRRRRSEWTQVTVNNVYHKIYSLKLNSCNFTI